MNQARAFLYPFNQTRKIKNIRIGIFTIEEKWEMIADKFPEEFNKWQSGAIPEHIFPTWSENSTSIEFQPLEYIWLIPELNNSALKFDFDLITKNRKSEPLPEHCTVISPENVFIEQGAKILPCILNASNGPVYIGKNSLIMEGCCIRGPFALCEAAVLKMGTRVYGATTIGPYSVAGGEIKNSLIMEFSNKAHDGYLGDSVIGSWCNLGAGTSNSNVKNTAGLVKIYLKEKQEYIPAGYKHGLFMGDYSRSAINTAFNTGTVVGIGANVFGSGLTPKYIPDFSWGMEGELLTDFDRLIASVKTWMLWKGKEISESEIQQLKHIFEQNLKRKA